MATTAITLSNRPQSEREAATEPFLGSRDPFSVLLVYELTRCIRPKELFPRTREHGGERRDSSKRGVHRKMIEPKSFDRVKDVWGDYRGRFDIATDWNGWTDDGRTDAMLLSMEGDLAGLIHGHQEFCHFSYEEVCQSLDDRFGAAITVAIDKKKLTEQKKEPKIY